MGVAPGVCGVAGSALSLAPFHTCPPFPVMNSHDVALLGATGCMCSLHKLPLAPQNCGTPYTPAVFTEGRSSHTLVKTGY